MHLQGKEILFVNRSLSIHTSLSHTKVVKKMYKSYSKVIKNLQKHASKYQKTQKNSQNLAILTVLLEAPPGSPPSAELRRGFRPGFCARARRVRSDEGGVPPTQKRTLLGAFALEAPPGIGPGMKVLQTSALPLGYGVFCTMWCIFKPFLSIFALFPSKGNQLETSLETSLCSYYNRPLSFCEPLLRKIRGLFANGK